MFRDAIKYWFGQTSDPIAGFDHAVDQSAYKLSGRLWRGNVLAQLLFRRECRPMVTRSRIFDELD